MADSTINGLTELETVKDDDLLVVWEHGAPTNQTKKVSVSNYRKFSIVEATCDSAGTDNTKVINILVNGLPERIAVTFTHANTVGDSTDPDFVPLILRVNYNGNTADFSICDSLGNYAGKGFAGISDGGIVIFQLLSNKALIVNSDIRQKETNYIIKSDGFIILPDKPDYAHPKTITGNTWTTDERVYVCYTAYGDSDYVLKLNGLRISSRTSSSGKYINDFNGIIEAGQELNATYLSIDTITRVYPLKF